MKALRWALFPLIAFGLLSCTQPPSDATSTSAQSVPRRSTIDASAAASSTVGEATEAALPAAGCLDIARQLNLSEQVGQLYMMAINPDTPIDTAVAQMQASGAGAVILLGNRTEPLTQVATYTRRLQAASPAQFPVLVAVDQEGGLVQRLQGPGFETIPAAIEQAQVPADQLRADWQRWGGQLAQAGVLFDLAPVADVVPADQAATNEAIGQLRRGFGADAAVVSDRVTQVVQGLASAGVASSVKHFPGLGQVPQNTDLAVGHDNVSLLTEAELAPFQAAIDAGASSVMVSSAIYDRVDPANPAVFSSQIVTGILRERMGFDGLIVSDDLGVAAAVASYDVSTRGLAFLQAGGDLVIVADPQAAQAMVDATLAAAQSDPGFAAALTDKVARLFAVKAEVGLMTCS